MPRKEGNRQGQWAPLCGRSDRQGLECHHSSPGCGTAQATTRGQSRQKLAQSDITNTRWSWGQLCLYKGTCSPLGVIADVRVGTVETGWRTTCSAPGSVPHICLLQPSRQYSWGQCCCVCLTDEGTNQASKVDVGSGNEDLPLMLSHFAHLIFCRPLATSFP